MYYLVSGQPSKMNRNTSKNGTNPIQTDGYDAVISNFPNGVLVLFDSDLRYRIVGPETLPFSGRKAHDMVGQTIYDLFPEDTAKVLEPELRDTINGNPRSFDVEYDGRVHHIETKPAAINNQPFGVLVTQDVTEERELAEELALQNKRLDQFTSIITHDLRNPLSIARGELELYRETGNADRLDHVEESIDRIEEIIGDLTSISRQKASPEESEVVSIANIASNAWNMVDTKSAELTVEDCTITANETQLQTLFENLFRNAVSHGGENVTVRVGTLDEGFFIEDTGGGIPSNQRKKILNHGYSTGDSGSGVGFTIVKRIAQRHGLSISVSESDEGGARFEFSTDTGEN